MNSDSGNIRETLLLVPWLGKVEEAVLDELVRSRGMGLILISHNLHLVAAFCDRVLVMYAGQVVESCDANRLAEARHPYTRGLLAALPELGRRRQVLPQLVRDPAWLEADPAL